MMSFYEDTDFATYSVSLLDAGKSSRMACSILSPVEALSYKSTPTPVLQEALSTLRIIQPSLSGSISGWGSSVKKYAGIFPFNGKRG